MLDVITIGTATRDVFLLSKGFKVLRDPKHLQSLGFKTGEAECFALGSKIEVQEIIFAVGGGAVNAAITFSRQGFETAALVKLGEDESGKAIANVLKREKVSILTPKDKKESTAYSVILLTQGGERTILVYRGASENLSERETPKNKLKARWAYFAPGAIPFDVIKNLFFSLKKQNVRIAMNPSSYYLNLPKDKLFSLLKHLDVVILNREEASYFTGADYGNEKAIFKKFDALIDGIAVMTDGAKGASVSDGKYVYRAGIFKEKRLVDRSGAGDAFGSGFVAGLMKKNDISYALRLASANAASVVENIGANADVLKKDGFLSSRWRYLDLDIEPL